MICKEWLVENVLMKSDKVTMSSSIECRCPFLDIDLAEFYFSQSGNEKIYNKGGLLDQKIMLKEYLKSSNELFLNSLSITTRIKKLLWTRSTYWSM